MNLFKTVALAILILILSGNVFSAKDLSYITSNDSHKTARTPCWTQPQQSCFFIKLFPFTLAVLVLGFFGYLKFERRLNKILTKKKVIFFFLFLAVFYLVCVLLLRFFFARGCL